jgi:hypothetical protein
MHPAGVVVTAAADDANTVIQVISSRRCWTRADDHHGTGLRLAGKRQAEYARRQTEKHSGHGLLLFFSVVVCWAC